MPRPQKKLSDVPEQRDPAEQHVQQSSSLMASLSDYLNHSFSSRENSPAVRRQNDSDSLPPEDKQPSPLLPQAGNRRRSMHSHTEEVFLNKASSPVGLGMTIMGGSDTSIGHIIVTDVNKTGPARDAGIEMGDEIVEVNGMPLTGMKNAAVIDVLRETRASVRLLVGKAAGPKTPKSSPVSPDLRSDSTPSSSVPVTPRKPALTETDGAESAAEGAPPLPEISPPGSRPTSAISNRIGNVTTPNPQGSPHLSHIIHRRSLTSIPSAKDVHDASGSDDSDERSVSIVPMALRQSRKRTRQTRAVRSSVSSEYAGSNESMRNKPPVTPIKKPDDTEGMDRVIATSPPPILPSGFSLEGTPTDEEVLGPEMETKPSAEPDDQPPPVPPQPASYPPVVPEPPARKSSFKASTPPPVAPYRPSTPPGTPRKSSQTRSGSFSSPLATAKASPSPKVPRKSSLSRMRSSPIPSTGSNSPKKGVPSPETKYRPFDDRSAEDGDITIGKRSTTGLFELQLRKSIAGLGVSTKRGLSGAVLVKSAPSGRSGDLR